MTEKKRRAARLRAVQACGATLLLGVVASAVLHAAGDVLLGGPARRYHLDGEQNYPALYSALLLAAAAASFGLLVRLRVLGRSGAVLPLLFGLMAADEAFVLHEHLEGWTGVDWQILYAPLILLGGWSLLRLLLRLGEPLAARVLLFTGGAAWGVSQVLEQVQWDGDVQRTYYTPLMVTEELLEMTGSSLLLLAAMVLIALGPSAHRLPPSAPAQRTGRVPSDQHR